MAWIKKNLFIVMAAVVSLGVLGYAIFFVKGKMDEDAEVAAQLDEKAAAYKALLDRKQHPGNNKTDNIKAAKEQLERVKSFADQMKEYLKGKEFGTNLSNRDFRALLDVSITQLQKEAEESGIGMPSTNFWFGFSPYKSTVDFKGNLGGLAAQLEDIKAIMHVLYQARVHSLVALRRVPVSDTEYGGGPDYIGDRQPRTNDFAINTGYEITFQGFSSELARVMEGLANAKQCFVVKSLGVAQAPEEKKPGASAVMMAPPMMPMMPNDPYARYRRPQQPMFTPPPQPKARPETAQKTVLDENKLRFTVAVDSIRLKPKQ